MMRHIRRLLNILSDGEFHSGEALGKQLGITRSAVWKIFQQLPKLGIHLKAVNKQGCRLNDRFELLDKDIINEQLSAKAQQVITQLDLLESVNSTNTHLLDQAKSGVKSGHVCLAEHQSAGRGRRGREWVSPYGRNIYLSVLWCFDADPAALSGLSLAVGVAIIRALKAYGLQDLGLKWPNDVLCKGQKLAGTLIELFGESHQSTTAVIGVGLNVSMPDASTVKTDMPWIDVAQIAGNQPARNQLAGLLLNELVQMLMVFEEEGFAAFLADYRREDALQGQSVKLLLPTGELSGMVQGVSSQGELLLRDGQGESQAFTQGEVSVRWV